MRLFRHFSTRVLAGVSLLAAGACVSHADTATFTLGNDPLQSYMGVNVGPYSGALTGTAITEFFCLDSNLSSNWGAIYNGTTSAPSGQAQDEIAFLTSYLLSQGPPSSDPHFVHTYEGPITFAIWQIMGTLGSTPPDPAAAQYVALAQQAFNNGLITSQFLNHFLVFTPNDTSVQRFITPFQDDSVTPVPEPKTMLLVAGGLGLIAICRLRWRRVV